MLVHVDTDLGRDPDDACALALLLGWDGVEIVGVTTTSDADGRRAAYVRHCLGLVGRSDIPVAAGAAVSMTTGDVAQPYVGEPHWPASITAEDSPRGTAMRLLLESIDRGATVIGIGPYTNLAQLEEHRPGSLSGVPVVVMGGWIQPPGDGFPAWGPEVDWNVQWDTRAAEVVARAATTLTLVALPPTLKSHLRAVSMPRLRASGPLGALLARQTEARARDTGVAQLARAHARLPDDLLNFHYDPVACAVAVGWPGAIVDDIPLAWGLCGDTFRWYPAPTGKLTHVLVDLDAAAFDEVWLESVERAQRRSRRSSSARRGRHRQ